MPTQWAINKANEVLEQNGINMVLNRSAIVEAFANAFDEMSAETGDCREVLADAYKEMSGTDDHAIDCATSRAPAMMPGPCDCHIDARVIDDLKTIVEASKNVKPIRVKLINENN